MRVVPLSVVLLALLLPAPLAAQDAKPGAPAAPVGDWTELGQVGDWFLERRGDAAAPEECAVWRMTGQEEGLRLSHGAGGTVIAFVGWGSAANPGPIPVTVYWNGTLDTRSDEVMPLDDSRFWRGMTLASDGPDGRMDLFMNGSAVTFVYQDQDGAQQVLTFPLTGSSRAARAVFDCAMPGSSQNPVRADSAPAAGQPYVLAGSCSLVVEGRTLLDRRGDCPIWMQNDGTGAFWINTDREAYLGEYFASIEPRGDGTASGHWNGMPGATHAQAFLGEDFRMGGGGCWSNARATICAAR